MQRLTFAFVFAVSVAMLGTAANARPNVHLQLHGALVERDAKGIEKLTPVEGVALKPGESVRYDIVVSNAGNEPAAKLLPIGKIPLGTSYEVGSASNGNALRVEFSIDGGKTWSLRPLVKVQTPDGVVEKPADASAYTTIRWVASRTLDPKTSLTYHYDVKVK